MEIESLSVEELQSILGGMSVGPGAPGAVPYPPSAPFAQAPAQGTAAATDSAAPNMIGD
jgi:hypothetical protein